jgi:hypothetical protein
VTLIEVLVALFITAVGLMALLTLFPLGALSMAQAIKDERSADEADNLAAVARAYWMLAVENNPSDPEPGADAAMLNPSAPAVGPMPDRTGTTGPSYPVYIDLFGSNAYPPPWTTWLAGQANGVPRRRLNGPLSLAGTPPYNQTNVTLSLFSGLDDLTLGESGTPPSSPTSVDREGRYSAALLLRRSDCTEPRFVDVTVIVYSGRSLQFTQDLAPAGETPYTANFQAGSTVVQVKSLDGTKPGVRRGDWVMDAWMYDPNPNSPYVNDPPRGYFYRVVSVNDVRSDTVELELQTPAKAGAGNNGQTGPALILDNVVEVFEKPTMGP